LNTQKRTVTKAIDCGADYLLPVKGNQQTLLEEITSAFNQLDIDKAKAEEHWKSGISKAKEHRDNPRLQRLIKEGPRASGDSFWESTEKGHGRIEIRSCTVMSAKDLASKDEWKGLSIIVRICRTRRIGKEEESETTYYIGSLRPDAELVASVARKHWGVENNLHGRLDIVFRQDDSRYRDRMGARNLAVVRKIALNAVSKETSIKGGIATRQYAASFNPVYRDKILKNLF
jgi:predicted transposase YbfD/YdcC